MDKPQTSYRCAEIHRAYILQLPSLLVTVNGAHAQAQARALVLTDCGLVHAASLTEYVTLTPL